MKYFIAAFVFIITGCAAIAQVPKPVHFRFNAERINDSTAIFNILASIDKGTELFTTRKAGPADVFLSALNWDSSSVRYLAFADSLKEAGIPAHAKDADGNPYSFYQDSVLISVPLRVPAATEARLRGNFTWLAKNGQEFPSGSEPFSLTLPAMSGKAETASVNAVQPPPAEKKSLWEIFLQGFGAGLLAFIMPCIYAMVPVTVSFFTKRSKTRKQGIINALVYASSIIGIFTLIGFLITILFGEGALNALASSAVFNISVFILFVIFGISFLGAFEITLPASWSNKVDSKAGLNSYSGIFFLALTLVIVSFSCTVPFIGGLTVLISKGSYWAPFVGFFAFSLALSLPFAIFTIFPSLLNSLGKSGGWLNSIKVVLGFVELALALKFLSSADLAYHWRILDREVYLSLWIAIFGLTGLYLLGKIKFRHDSELPTNDYGLPYLTVTRLFFAIAAFSFTIYLVPGLWGAPLNGISAWIPETKTQDFNLNKQGYNGSTASSSAQIKPVKYTDFLESEIPGVTTFFDLEEGMAAAKQLKLPVMIDFTGHSCANCRKMERQVLSNEAVVKSLAEDFVVVSLYVDDKFELPEAEWTKTSDGSIIKQLGSKNLQYEVRLTNNNAQPYYVFLDLEGKLLVPEGYGYVPGVPQFLAHLDRIKTAFKKRN